MALYHAEIIFTGNKEYLERPEPRRICVRARTLDLAAKRVVKYAKKFWPLYRFEVELLDCDRVLK